MLLLLIAGLLAVGEAELKATLVITGDGGAFNEAHYLRGAPHSASKGPSLDVPPHFVAPLTSLSFAAVDGPSCLGFCACCFPQEHFEAEISSDTSNEFAQIGQQTFGAE